MAREATDMEKYIFGQNVKIDPKTDNPIEQGLGSVANPTDQHKAALALAIQKRERLNPLSEVLK